MCIRDRVEDGAALGVADKYAPEAGVQESTKWKAKGCHKNARAVCRQGDIR